MGRKKDEVWANVETSESGDLSCKYCQMKISGGASRIRSHLSGVKGRGIEVCLKVPEEVRLKACEGIDIPNKRIKTEATSNNVLESETSSRFSLIPRSNYKEEDKHEMDERLAKFLLIAQVSPNDALRSDSLHDFLEGIIAYGHNYKRPDYFTLESQSMENIRKEANEYYDNAIINSAGKGCSLIYSRYCSKKDLFAWTPNGLIHMKSCSSSRDIEIITTAIKEIGAANVVQFIFHNFEYDIRDMLGREYPHIYHIPCVSRAICRLLQKVLDLDLVHRVVEAACIFSDKICMPGIKVEGREMQYQRRKSTACKVYEFVSLFKTECEWRDLYDELRQQLDSNISFSFELYVFDSGFLSEVKIVASIIRPLFKALFLAYGNGSSSGQLYGAMQEVEDAVRECCKKDHNLDKVQNLLKTHRRYIIQPVHAAAAFLNPAYMFGRNLYDDEMMQGISNICEKLLQVDEKEAFMNQVDQYRLLMPNMTPNEVLTVHPQTWWELKGKRLHVLQKYAIRILGQPCSSLLSLHYQLHQENHEFGINVALIERFKSPQIQMQEPSILEDLDLIFDEILSKILEDLDLIFDEIPSESLKGQDPIYGNLAPILGDVDPIVGDVDLIVRDVDPTFEDLPFGMNGDGDGIPNEFLNAETVNSDDTPFGVNGDLDGILNDFLNIETATFGDISFGMLGD